MSVESAALAAVCRNKDIATLLSEDVDPFFQSYGDIWRSIKNYYAKYRSEPSVEEIQERFPDWDPPPTNGKTVVYLDQLRNEFIKSQVRQILMSTGSELTTESGARTLEHLQNKVASLSKFTSAAKDIDLTDAELAMRHFEQVRERSELMGGSPGIPTGFKAIDAAYHTGMAPGHLINVIGWPGRGKTFVTGYLAVKAWQMGYKPMIVTLEMTPETMRDRIYTTMGSGFFDMRAISRGEVDRDDFKEWSRQNLTDKNGFIVVSNEGVGDVTPNTIQGKIDQHKPDIVIVDYHQLISDNARSSNPTQRAMAASRELKLLAVRNNIPIVDILAATSDETSDRNSPPTLGQVAWSKAIEYDSDHAFAVHRDNDTGLIEVVCRKNRHGSMYAFHIEADLGRGIFKEIYG